MSNNISEPSAVEIAPVVETEIANRIKAMTPEQLNVVVKTLPSKLMFEELMRRDEEMTETNKKIRNILGD